MAEQNVGEQASSERTGRHAAPDAADTTSDAAPTEAPTQKAEVPTQEAEAPTRQVETPTTVAGPGPAEAPTRQEEAPTQHVGTSGYGAAPAPEPTRRMDGPQGPPPVAPAAPVSGRGSGGAGARRAVRRVTGFLATLLRIVGLLLALVLAAFVVLSLIGVNPDNGVAQLVAAGADTLVLSFRDLFLPADPRVALAVNYGLAALFWLVLGLVAARVVRALGRLV